MSSEFPSAPVPLAVGDEMPAFALGPLTRSDFVRYAGAGGDFNPVHYDEAFAREAGHPSVFGQGMLPAGILASRLVRWLGPDNLRSYRVRFSGQFWPGDELTFGGWVERIDADAGEERATVLLQVVSQEGAEVLSASASVACASALP